MQMESWVMQVVVAREEIEEREDEWQGA